MLKRELWISRVYETGYDDDTILTVMACVLFPKVKDMTMDIANVLLKIDNSKLANDDFQNKLV